jgi:sigma-B regulation protein RsbU (phosphoserine phosphatase)
MDSDRDTQTEDLEDLYENAPCGYLSLGPDGLIIKSNKTLSRWLGIPAQDLLGKRMRDLLNTAGRIFYETHFAPLLRLQGHFDEVALDLKLQDGSRFPVIANATEKRNADNELLFTRVMLFRATERRRYERQLVDARAAADAAGAEMQIELDIEHRNAELREQFIAVLGHDLRNPLASISAASRLLRRETATAKATTLLDLMQGSVQRMSDLIDNVLDFARGRLGGGIGLQIRPEELAPIILHVVDELRSSDPDRIIEADINLDQPVACDGGRIGQMVSNLVGNSITYGQVDAPIRISAGVSGQNFQIWVANQGTPIPKDVQASLFEPFIRGEASGNRQGLGLGLHIASEIARAHGGRLDVASDAIETRFTFTMPLAQIADDNVGVR